MNLIPKAISLLILLAGCSKPNTTDYFPLTRNLRKEYSVEFSSPLGATQKGRRVREVTGVEQIDGKEYFRINLVFENMPWARDRIEYQRLAPEGVYTKRSKTEPEVLTTPFPFKVGANWEYMLGGKKVEITGSVMEDFVSITKSYKNCVKLYSRSPTGEGYEYLAPGMGTVGGTYKVTLPNQAPLTLKEVITSFRK